MKKVCIIQAVIKQYRTEFFDLLYKRLLRENVILTVIYSDPNEREALRKDATDLPSIYGCKVPAFWFFNYHILYQPCFFRAIRYDLIVVEQASKHVVNILLLLMRFLGLCRIAFWGHGKNWQQDGVKWMDYIKRFLVGRVDWWFAYTKMVADYVVSNGFSSDRVTIVQNSVDVTSFRKWVYSISSEQKRILKSHLHIDGKAPIGIFCGSMHELKKVDFLIEAAVLTRTRVPNFHLILVGAGPRDSVAQEAAAKFSWIHFVGPCFGIEKAKYFAISDLFLCPGLVGLAIVESFAAGLPLFTTEIQGHSPEIEYLIHSVNGEISFSDPRIYANAVSDCLLDPVKLDGMRKQASKTGLSLGIDRMVENFAQGVLSCLKKS